MFRCNCVPMGCIDLSGTNVKNRETKMVAFGLRRHGRRSVRHISGSDRGKAPLRPRSMQGPQ